MKQLLLNLLILGFSNVAAAANPDEVLFYVDPSPKRCQWEACIKDQLVGDCIPGRGTLTWDERFEMAKRYPGRVVKFLCESALYEAKL